MGGQSMGNDLDPASSDIANEETMPSSPDMWSWMRRSVLLNFGDLTPGYMATT